MVVPTPNEADEEQSLEDQARLQGVRLAARTLEHHLTNHLTLTVGYAELIAEDPELQQVLRDRRDQVPNFVEETLRIESPVKGDFRLARVPTTVGGVDIPAGTTLMVLNGAANRDPRVFPDPDDFDVDRANARAHISFGHGIHTCPGAPLARAEGRVSVERLLDRMSDIRISESEHGPAAARRYEYVPTFILRGTRHLHLEFDA